MKISRPSNEGSSCFALVFFAQPNGTQVHTCLPGKYLFRLVLSCFAIPLSLISISSLAQPLLNVNYGNLDFYDANKFHKKGNLGQTAGSRTLYTDVVSVNGRSVDCIITTMSITNGYFEYPVGYCSGTIPFDYKAPQNCSGNITISGNEDRFFCPTLYFQSGGGSCRFKFEFIVGGSYNDVTDKGSPVILQNVMVNSYDIDGNANCATPNPAVNQYNDFSGFKSAVRANPQTRISTQYNSATGMTRFISTMNCNIADVKDPSTRVRVQYNYLQEFEMEVGMTGIGRAFFMLDFSQGTTFNTIADIAPELDLNTLSDGDGYNNISSFCATPEHLTKGPLNVTSQNNSIEQINISIQDADVRDGNAEILTTDFSTSSQHIQLGLPFSGTQTTTVTGTTYTINKTVSGTGVRKLQFTKSDGGNMTSTEAEKLLDALVYYNFVNTPGLRRFSVWFKEGVMNSNTAFFDVYGGCIVLNNTYPILDGRADQGRILLTWKLGDPTRIQKTHIERVVASQGEWEKVYERISQPKDQLGQIAHWNDVPLLSGTHRYRLVETDFFGTRRISAEKTIRYITSERTIFYPNPASSGSVQVLMERPGPIAIFNLSGSKVFQSQLHSGIQRISLRNLPPGRYTLITEKGSSTLLIQ